MLAIFYNGTPVNVISQADGWCYVLVGGLNGYFRAEFLSFAGGGGNAGPATVYSSNGGRVNMRTGPSYAYNAAWQLSHGTTVTVLLKGTRFWQISHGGNVGFVDSNFLRSGTSPAPSPGGTGNAVVRKGANLNLREQPNLNARVLSVLPAPRCRCYRDAMVPGHRARHRRARLYDDAPSTPQNPPQAPR